MRQDVRRLIIDLLNAELSTHPDERLVNSLGCAGEGAAEKQDEAAYEVLLSEAITEMEEGGMSAEDKAWLKEGGL